MTINNLLENYLHTAKMKSFAGDIFTYEFFANPSKHEIEELADELTIRGIAFRKEKRLIVFKPYLHHGDALEYLIEKNLVKEPKNTKDVKYLIINKVGSNWEPEEYIPEEWMWLSKFLHIEHGSFKT